MVVTRSGVYRAAVLFLLLAGSIGTTAAPAADAGANAVRITILYDAFGKPSALKKDWGYAAYISSLPSTFYRRDPSLPPEQRYFEGSPPQVMKFGSAWPRAHFELVDNARDIAPGIHLISLVSDKPGTLRLGAMPGVEASSK